MSDKTAGWKFAEGVALNIMKQDRQLISSRAIGMIAAEFDAATAECDCTAPTPPTTPAAAARDALVAAIIAEEDATLEYESTLTDVATMTAVEMNALTKMNDCIRARMKASTEYRIAKAAEWMAAQEPTP